MTGADRQTGPASLPVEEVLPELMAALAGGTAVLVAEAGAGKTTLVPLGLLGADWLAGSRILVLEPRRVAARAAATRMATLLGEAVGQTVGYVTRDARRTSRSTRIEVVTEAILTRRLQADPSLPGVGAVVFDELHERHLHTDLGLALALDARDILRPDLRLLAMSATIAAPRVADVLGGAPVVTSVGRAFPVEIRWAPLPAPGRLATGVAGAIRRSLGSDAGDILVFLPGIGEIRAVASALGEVAGVEVLPLHGGLSPEEQDHALRAGPARRVVLSTDLAESSVTVEGVGVVIDGGLARRPAYDPSTGLSGLRTGLASRASADQRSGRAGRLRPGVAYRLWSEAEHQGRRAWPDPEIVTADLAGLALELAVWGSRPEDLRWIDPPPAPAMERATGLLHDLGALEDGRPTALGRRLCALPLHPRLGAMLHGAPPQHRRTASYLCALLSERDLFAGDGMARTADVAERLAVLRGEGPPPPGVDRAALSVVRRQAGDLLRRVGGAEAEQEPADPGPLLASAYPDRLAQARGGGRYRLRHGGGATLPPHDPLSGAPWLVAAEVTAGDGDPDRVDGRIRLAGLVDRVDVERVGADGVRVEVTVEWDDTADDLRSVTQRTLDALFLDTSRGTAPPGPATAGALLRHAVQRGLTPLGWTAAARTLQARVGWARQAFGDPWPDVSDPALMERADQWLLPALEGATGRADLARIDPAQAIRAAIGPLGYELDQQVPATLTLSGGRRVPVDYGQDRPRISVRAQDLFGTTIHPSIARGRIPLTVEVLSPAGRPVQVTSDLPGFWQGSWHQVRKEMAARYPKHPWPTDPSVAAPPPARR